MMKKFHKFDPNMHTVKDSKSSKQTFRDFMKQNQGLKKDQSDKGIVDDDEMDDFVDSDADQTSSDQTQDNHRSTVKTARPDYMLVSAIKEDLADADSLEEIHENYVSLKPYTDNNGVQHQIIVFEHGGLYYVSDDGSIMNEISNGLNHLYKNQSYANKYVDGFETSLDLLMTSHTIGKTKRWHHNPDDYDLRNLTRSHTPLQDFSRYENKNFLIKAADMPEITSSPISKAIHSLRSFNSAAIEGFIFFQQFMDEYNREHSQHSKSPSNSKSDSSTFSLF